MPKSGDSWYDSPADRTNQNIIFQDAVTLIDLDVKRAIITSVITNSLECVGAKETIEIPETSLIMLGSPRQEEGQELRRPSLEV
jgi:hypothetical protein